jgi:hypothetical protein
MAIIHVDMDDKEYKIFQSYKEDNGMYTDWLKVKDSIPIIIRHHSWGTMSAEYFYAMMGENEAVKAVIEDNLAILKEKITALQALAGYNSLHYSFWERFKFLFNGERT